MTNNRFTVATASQLRGSKSWNGVEEIPGVDVMDYADPSTPKRASGQLRRRSAVRKSVRLASSVTCDDLTSSDSTARSESQSPSTSPVTDPGAYEDDLAPVPQLLMPVCYSPPDSKQDAHDQEVTHEVNVVTSAGGNQRPVQRQETHRLSRIIEKLAPDTDPNHKRQASGSSNSSSSSRRGRKDAIYFTPTDVTRSQIFLSSPHISPIGSPTLPKGNATSESSNEDDASTPRASGFRRLYDTREETPQQQADQKSKKPSSQLTIKPEQLDKLVTTMVKCKLVQRDVRKHWWDDEGIPYDESVSTMTSVTTPTLTSASTLYSQPNDIFLNNGLSLDIRQAMSDRGLNNGLGSNSTTKKLPAGSETSFGGIALVDPSVHGSPIRSISTNYRVSNHILGIGACSFITVPYDVDVECNLRIEPASTSSPNVHVLLQCINQIVDRKSGLKTSLLLAEIDVTPHFHRACLAELSAISSLPTSDISVANSPILPTESPDIDWIALADDLQSSALVADTVDTTIKHINFLTRDHCSMSTLALLSELSRIKDAHQDFLIMKPISWHENGVPSNVKLPWVSRRLWRDWYDPKQGRGKEGIGHSKAAREFQRGIVAEVAKRTATGEGDGEFICRVDWEGEGVAVKCVALGEGRERRELWACFVQGMFELDD